MSEDDCQRDPPAQEQGDVDMNAGAPDPREAAIEEFKKKVMKHKEYESKVKGLRERIKEMEKEYDKTEDDLKALQSVGQIIGEVLRQLD